MSLKIWQRSGSEQWADCRVFKVRRDLLLHPRDGGEHEFFIIEAPDWVNIIPLTADNEVVMIEQYRHGTGEITLEIPGGIVDENEKPFDAALRELLEETGYAALDAEFLGRTHPNPALQDNWVHTYLARDVRYQSEPRFDGAEQIAVRLVPLSDVPRLIADGIITHSLVVTGFHLLSLFKNSQESENLEFGVRKTSSSTA